MSRTQTDDERPTDELEGKQLLFAAEGGAVYVAESDGMPCVYIDEGVLADFLDAQDRTELVKVHRFKTVEDRSAYLQKRGWPQEPLAEALLVQIEVAVLDSVRLESLRDEVSRAGLGKDERSELLSRIDFYLGEFEAGRANDAWARLAANRTDLANALTLVPEAPGLYAIHALPEVWRMLGLGDPPDERPLYVGKSESSLAAREFRTHFCDGRTASSALRRSFAALLRDELLLTAIPRNRARSTAYGLSDYDDIRLTDWMMNNLEIATWASEPGDPLGRIVRSLLEQWEPPLNLIGVRTLWTSEVKRARSEMAREAGQVTGAP